MARANQGTTEPIDPPVRSHGRFGQRSPSLPDAFPFSPLSSGYDRALLTSARVRSALLNNGIGGGLNLPADAATSRSTAQEHWGASNPEAYDLNYTPAAYDGQTIASFNPRNMQSPTMVASRWIPNLLPPTDVDLAAGRDNPTAVVPDAAANPIAAEASPDNDVEAEADENNDNREEPPVAGGE